jgi:hypothetical protein
MLLALASAIFLWSEPLGSRDNILLSQRTIYSLRSIGVDRLENTASNHSSIVVYVRCLAIALVLLPV